MRQPSNKFNMSVVSKEQAQKEVDAFLDFKRISSGKRIACEKNIERLVDAVCDGTLVINEDTKEITQKLHFPVSFSELKYKPRLTAKQIQNATNGLKPEDSMGRAFGYIACATGEDRNVVASMDAEDYSIAGDIVIFFMF